MTKNAIVTPLANRPTAEALWALAEAEAAVALAGRKLGRVPARLTAALQAARWAVEAARAPRRFAPLGRRQYDRAA